MRRWLPIALLLAVAGLVGFLLFRHSTRVDPVEAARVQPEGGQHPELPPVELAGQPDSIPERAPLVPAPVAPSGESATDSKPDPALGHLTVRVLGKTSRAPLASVRVMLSPKVSEASGFRSENLKGSKGDLEHCPVTGADGVASFDLPPGRDLSLWARGEDEKSGDANTEIQALGAGEQRELVLEIADGVDGHVVGKVVCSETGEPVAGAHVSQENTGAGHTFTMGGNPIRNRGKPASGGLTTGNDGVFEFACSLWAHPRLCVEAEGYGLRYANVDGLHADLAHALVVHVSRAATLNARVLDAGGAPIEEGRVELTTKGYLLSYSEADAESFLPGGFFSSPPDESWSVATGADGRARIAGIPPRVELGLRIEASGLTVFQDPVGLTLEPGEVKELEWRIGSGTTVQGLVLDQHGKPVSGIAIWASNAASERRRFFLRYERERVASKSQTDGDGRFTLRDLRAGSWCIGPGAEPDSQIASVAELVELAGEPTRELTLHVFRGLYIRGRVISPSGELVPNAWLNGMADSLEFFGDQHAGQDGTFAFGPLAPGTVTLSASSMNQFASSDPVRASAGDTGVVLQLKQGGAIRGRVVDAVTGAACAAELVFMPEHASAGVFGNGMMTPTQEDGVFSRAGFEPGRWSVTASSADGRFAQHAHIDVAPGSDSGELVFALSPGGKLHLGYKGAEPQVIVTITAQGAAVNFATGIEPGKFTDCLAPAGALVLEIRKAYDGPARTKAVELKPGETKEITLTDED